MGRIPGKTLIALAIMGSVVPAQALAQSEAQLTHVPSANPKMAGFVAPNILSRELEQIVWANGAMKLENPTALIGFYGYYNDGPHIPAPGAVQVPGSTIEATKTDPDKNTYLVLDGKPGRTAITITVHTSCFKDMNAASRAISRVLTWTRMGRVA